MNRPDERLVYLAFRTVFVGVDAQVRNLKTIRDRIQKHQHLGDVTALLKEHDLESVCNAAKTLLKDEVFESTLRAKLRFPEVFEVSPAQSAEREVSEAEAAKTEADAMKCAAEGRLNELVSTGAEDEAMPVESRVRENEVRSPSFNTRKLPAPYSGVSIPSLYPIYLHLPTQHRLLRAVQEILESCCYTFAQKSLHDIVEKKEWDCAESVELNVWSSVFLSNKKMFSAESLEKLGKPFAKILDSLAQLRHTAVHRIRVTVSRVEQFLLDAESFSRLLEDNNTTDDLVKLRRATKLAVDDMKRNKDLLESRVAETLRNFAAQRAEIKRLEDAAVDDMLREDKAYQASVSANLNQEIDPSQARAANGSGVEKAISEGDIDAESLSEHNVSYDEAS